MEMVIVFPSFNVNVFGDSGDAELQCVPGSFDSVQEYVNVFEPLLFEECRAQLLSTWEELCEGVAAKDPHIQVCVKSIERRERGNEKVGSFFPSIQNRP